MQPHLGRPAWFERAETDDTPWIIYMPDAFTDHCITFIGDLLNGFGAFVWAASADGRIEMWPRGTAPWLTE